MIDTCLVFLFHVHNLEYHTIENVNVRQTQLAYVDGSMFAPHFRHLVSKQGTLLTWGALVPQFGQTHSLGPPVNCLFPPRPLPLPRLLKLIT